MIPCRTLGQLAAPDAPEFEDRIAARQTRRYAARPASAILLRLAFEEHRRPMTIHDACRAMGVASPTAAALAAATAWLPALYEDDRGRLWYAGVVDDPEVTA